MKKNGQAPEGRVSILKCGETLFEAEGLVRIQWESACVDGLMETVECMWVNVWCMLD